ETFGSRVGLVEYSPKLTNFIDELRQLKAQGAHLKLINIHGGASDDYLSKPAGGFVQPDAENNQLAMERAQRLKADITAQAQLEGLELPPIVVHSGESVEDKQLHDSLDKT